ncbi:MAG TPA: ABC transporter ATP-binding protein [Opitutaceae bacterium]|jgi:ATP-binding cassette subfamily B protein
MRPVRGLGSLGRDAEVLKHRLAPGTVRRVVEFGRGYAWLIALFLLLVVLDAATGVVNPLVFRQLIDRGILAGRSRVVVELACVAAGVSLLDSALTFAQRQMAASLGFRIVYDLRLRVFSHIQRMSLAFFSRARTGALVSRVNSDVSGVRDALSDILSSAVGNLVTVVLVLAAMLALSWRLTLASLLLLPAFIVTSRVVGRRIRALTKETYDRSAAMNSLMVERFNVAGALVSKVFGDPTGDREAFAGEAARVRDIGLSLSTQSRLLFISLGLMSSLAVIVVYGWGGVLAAERVIDLGTLVALVSYLLRLYGPLTALSNLQVDVMTTLVSFERVFEVLDLEPSIRQAPGARPIPAGPVRLVFDDVGFRYPTAAEVSLASLEAVPELSRDLERPVLEGVSFVAEPGQLVALVGASGAGKTTIAHLASRIYDVVSGSISANGLDLRQASLESVRRTFGMVMQDAHLFHDTVRANLLYARPGAQEADLVEALRAAQVLALVESLPRALDTVIGERGTRLSGGERQRIAIARLLLKAPPVVILDEATSALDSGSERAIQEAFSAALRGRTSLVIAHRLSTVQHADQILVLAAGRIVERGRHEELLSAGGTYSQLYRTQFAPRGTAGQSP